jgi:hypothetical protein
METTFGMKSDGESYGDLYAESHCCRTLKQRLKSVFWPQLYCIIEWNI